MYEYSVGGQDFRASQEERSLKFLKLLKSKRGGGGGVGMACLSTGPGDSKKVPPPTWHCGINALCDL